jgi:hydroxyethylthiazole kinase
MKMLNKCAYNDISEKSMIWDDIQKIRAESPLIHNITNYVVMNSTANALLAIGASPIMAHSVEEVQELAGYAKALVINIGTLSTPWIESMIVAGKEACKREIPVVLDPVGSGATKFRTATVQKLIEEIHPTVIRANATEIKSIVHSEVKAKGVDSLHDANEVLEDAVQLSRMLDCVVSVSGAEDIVVFKNSIARVFNGHPIMSKVTGMGCISSALTGAFLAINHSYFNACVHAMSLMGIAGELAAKISNGPGSFQSNFLDAIYNIDSNSIKSLMRIQYL